MSNEVTRKRTRSPAYPSIGLEAAIDLAKAIWDKEDRHPFTPEVAAADWGYKESSSGVGQFVSALKQFGLFVEDESAAAVAARRLRLAPIALDILASEPNSSIRKTWVKTAALNPKIHKEIWDKYGGVLPSDSSLKFYLTREREVPFNKEYVDKFIEQFRSTLAFADLAGPDKMVPADGNPSAGDEPLKVGDFVQWTINGKDMFESPRQVKAISDDGGYAFVPGTETGLSMEQLTKQESPTAAKMTAGAPPPNPFFKPETLAFGPPLRELPVTLPSLQIAFFKVPVPMSEGDYKTLVNSLTMMKDALVKQPDEKEK